MDKSEVDGLSVIDKLSIAFSLRKQISSDLMVNFDEKNKISEKINILSILEKFKNFNVNLKEEVEIKNDKVLLKVKLSYPSIKKELDYDLFFGKSSKKTSDIKTNEDVQKIISDAFLTEISKYIDILYINQNEININEAPFEQKIKIIEKLPSGLIQKILEKISSWKKNIDDILTVNFEDYKKVLTVDSVLFLS